MQTERNKKLPSFILCMVLIMTMALFATGCNESTDKGSSTSSSSNKEAETSVQQDDSDSIQADYKQLGEGKTKFMFTVVDGENSETHFEIHTDEKTVGDALSKLGLIEGEESTYGLYVKTVNGITFDYDKDGIYWAFYVNDEYAQTGVDSTPITEGESYSFKAEKG